MKFTMALQEPVFLFTRHAKHCLVLRVLEGNVELFIALPINFLSFDLSRYSTHRIVIIREDFFQELASEEHVA